MRKKENGIMGGIVIKWLVVKPKKPSSSLRKVVLTKLNKNGIKVYGYIPGITYGEKLLRELNSILLNKKGKKDVVNVNYRAIRGVRDLNGILYRTTSRSIYSSKKKIYKKWNNNNILLLSSFRFFLFLKLF